MNNLTVDKLKEIRFLSVLPPKYLQQVAGISQYRDFKGGEFIFHEGDPAKNVYLIESGSVSLKICAGGMGAKQIVTLAPGDLLGRPTMTNHPEFVATAIAEAPVRMVEIDGTKLHAMCDADQEFGYELL